MIDRQEGTAESVQATSLAARAVALLDDIATVARGQLEPLLAGAIGEAADSLFERAERSSSTEQQDCLDSQRILRHRRDGLVAQVIGELAAARQRFGQPPPQRAARQASKLELLEQHDQDENVVVDDLAARLESKASMILFELGYRFAVLGARPVLEADAQPFGPHILCRALQAAIGSVDILSAHRVEVYRAFERRAAPRIQAFYEALNQHLLDQGILPNLRAFAPRHRRLGGKRGAEPEPTDDASNAADTGTGAASNGGRGGRRSPEPTGAAGLPADAGESATGDSGDIKQAFAALTELLAQRRRQLGPGVARGAAHVPQADDLQKALAALQARPAEVRARDGNTRPRSMRELRQDMLAELRRMSPNASAPRLAPEQIDTVELMSMLFDRLIEDVNSPTGNQLLSETQAPLLRVALADKAFFTDHQHPARRWLDSMAGAFIRWGGDADDADHALNERMLAMARQVNQQYAGDPQMFEPLVKDLDQQVETLARKAGIAERRHVEAAKGRERLELARLRAEELIGARLRMHFDATPSLTRSLLQHAWTDVLALTLLREGEDSDNFRAEIAIADKLTTPPPKTPAADADPVAAEKAKQELHAGIEQGLARVGMPAGDAQLLAREATGEGESNGKSDSLTRTELALKLKQRKRLGSASDEEAAEFAEPAMSAAEQHALAEIKTLPFGTWFDIDNDDPPGSVRRRKIAWYSPRTGNCLLVNRRGARGDITKLEQLARGMVAGRVRIPPPDQGSLIDRALKGILGKLKSLVGSGEVSGSLAS